MSYLTKRIDEIVDKCIPTSDVNTQELLEERDESLIGVFSREMSKMLSFHIYQSYEMWESIQNKLIESIHDKLDELYP